MRKKFILFYPVISCSFFLEGPMQGVSVLKLSNVFHQISYYFLEFFTFMVTAKVLHEIFKILIVQHFADLWVNNVGKYSKHLLSLLKALTSFFMRLNLIWRGGRSTLSGWTNGVCLIFCKPGLNEILVGYSL